MMNTSGLSWRAVPHPLRAPDVVRAAQEAASAHLGQPWRMFGYLAVVAVAGGSPLGRSILSRLAATLRLYR
jgi:hypothetical protein